MTFSPAYSSSASARPLNQPNGNIVVKSTQLPDKFDAIHVRHEMVGNHNTDFGLANLAAQQGERACPLGGNVALNVSLCATPNSRTVS